MKYLDASAILHLVLREPGSHVPLESGDTLVSSQLVEVEVFRAMDRLRLVGALDDMTTATKRKELSDFVATLNLAAIDSHVIERAKASFSVNVRALDAVHVATAEILALEAEGETLEFWTHDERQATAALSRGLNVHGVQLR
jgi:uncharacterized protein